MPVTSCICMPPETVAMYGLVRQHSSASVSMDCLCHVEVFLWPARSLLLNMGSAQMLTQTQCQSAGSQEPVTTAMGQHGTEEDTAVIWLPSALNVSRNIYAYKNPSLRIRQTYLRGYGENLDHFNSSYRAWTNYCNCIVYIWTCKLFHRVSNMKKLLGRYNSNNVLQYIIIIIYSLANIASERNTSQHSWV